MRKPTDIDDYLSGVTGSRRKALDRLRKSIHAAVPKAEECISYGIPAFRLEGKVIAGFLATGKGCSYYPFSGSTLKALAREVAGYEQTAGALHFDPEKPLSLSLVKKLLRTRIGEIRRRAGSPR